MMGETNESEQLKRRRGFLTRSSILLAALGMSSSTAGLSEAQEEKQKGYRGKELTQEQVVILNRVMDEAVRTGDVGAALKNHRGDDQLPRPIVDELRQLNKEDLQAAARLDRKLEATRAAAPRDNNGIFGM